MRCRGRHEPLPVQELQDDTRSTLRAFAHGKCLGRDGLQSPHVRISALLGNIGRPRTDLEDLQALKGNLKLLVVVLKITLKARIELHLSMTILEYKALHAASGNVFTHRVPESL